MTDSTLADRLDRDPSPWRPEPGDRIIGEIVEIEMRHGDFGSWPALTLVDDDGQEWAVHLLGAVLHSAWERLRPAVHDAIAIKRLEDKAGARGVYKDFRVKLDRAEPSVEGPTGLDVVPDALPDAPELEQERLDGASWNE